MAFFPDETTSKTRKIWYASMTVCLAIVAMLKKFGLVASSAMLDGKSIELVREELRAQARKGGNTKSPAYGVSANRRSLDGDGAPKEVNLTMTIAQFVKAVEDGSIGGKRGGALPTHDQAFADMETHFRNLAQVSSKTAEASRPVKK